MQLVPQRTFWRLHRVPPSRPNLSLVQFVRRASHDMNLDTAERGNEPDAQYRILVALILNEQRVRFAWSMKRPRRCRSPTITR